MREGNPGYRDLLTTVLMDNADGIVIVSPDGTVLVANPEAERLFGRPPGGMTGLAFGVPVQSTDGGPSLIDVRSPPVTRTVEMRVADTRWRNEPARVVTLRDVTERQETENALRNFVQMTSHELRTPLSTVVGFAATMRDHWHELDDERKLHYLEIIQGQAERLGRLAEDLLRAARAEAGELELELTVQDLRELLPRAAEPAGVDYECRLPDEPLWASVDADRVEEILINYLTNARKYGEPPFVVAARRDRGMVVVEVLDHGRGVDRSFIGELFDRFARDSTPATREQDGSGLGLAIVRSLARAMGGDAWYRSNPAGGSCFCVSLPGADPPAEAGHPVGS